MKKKNKKTSNPVPAGWNALVKGDRMSPLTVLRILIGIVFVFTGGSKLIGPYQNFSYVIQAYEIFPGDLSAFNDVAARVVPWVEFFAGIFLVLGLWLKRSLQVSCVLFVSFLVVVGQAVVRKLPIDECGCFGEWVSVPLPYMLIFDTILLVSAGVMLARLKRASCVSLDSYFESTER